MTDDDLASSSDGSGLGRIRHTVEKLLQIDPSHPQRIFTLLLLGFVFSIISVSFTYRSDARLVPLVVAVPTLLMLVALFAIQIVPKLQSYIDQYQSSSMLSKEALEGGPDEEEEEIPLSVLRTNAIRTVVWIGFIGGSIYLLGHVIGITLALTLVFHYYSGLSWLRAIVFAIINAALITGLFLFAFNARLFPGILF